MTATTPPPLPADLTEGLKRLKMAAMRRLAPELLVTAKTQRWKPEEFLRTLVEAEIAARDASNARTRLRAGCVPGDQDPRASSTSRPPRSRAATFDYLGSLEWIRAAENVCLIGPAGTGKSHILVALGHRRRRGRAPGPVLHRRRPRRDPLPRPGRQLRRHASSTPCCATTSSWSTSSGFAPLDDTGAQLLFRFVAAAYERRSLGIGSHWPFESWGRFLPEHTTAVSMLDRLLHHCHTVVTDGDSYRMKQARERTEEPASRPADQPRRVGTSTWPKTGTRNWPLTTGVRGRVRAGLAG